MTRVGFKLTDVDPVILMRHARLLADQDPGHEADYYLAALNPSSTTYFVEDGEMLDKVRGKVAA